MLMSPETLFAVTGPSTSRTWRAPGTTFATRPAGRPARSGWSRSRRPRSRHGRTEPGARGGAGTGSRRSFPWDLLSAAAVAGQAAADLGPGPGVGGTRERAHEPGVDGHALARRGGL